MIKELRKHETEFAIELTASVEKRIKERRQVKHATLLAYLENPNFLHASVQFDKVLPYSSKADITKLMKDLYIRLFGGPSEEEQSQEPERETPIPAPQPPKRTKSQELREFKESEVNKAPDPSPEAFTSSSSRALAAVKSAMKTYETERKRPEMLDKVRDLLTGKIFFKNIYPSSQFHFGL